MLNKKWFTGALLSAFLGLGIITGGAQAEASAISAVFQPTSGVVIVVDPFHDHYRHSAPPPHHYRHHAPPPHHRKHHPRPHR